MSVLFALAIELRPTTAALNGITPLQDSESAPALGALQKIGWLSW
jgi:hypothetical protein